MPTYDGDAKVHIDFETGEVVIKVESGDGTLVVTMQAASIEVGVEMDVTADVE